MIKLSNLLYGKKIVTEDTNDPSQIDIEYFRQQLLELTDNIELYEREYANELDAFDEATGSGLYDAYRSNLARYMSNIAKQLNALDRQLDRIEKHQTRQ